MEKFSAREFRAAATLLEEYLDRYPSAPEAVDARYFLGQSLLFSKNAKAAVPVLTAVVEIRAKTSQGSEARIYLGQA